MPDGKSRYLSHTTAPIKDEAGKISHILKLTQDVTWKKLLEQQVIHQEKMAATGVFAASMAHEIGNPLNSIYAIVQFLQRKLDDPFIQENLKLLRTDIGRISRIVQDLVGFSRPSSREWEYVQLNDILVAAVGITRYDKRARDIQWVTNLEPQLPRVKIIGDQFLQVCLNLILNALDAMDGVGGTLTIKTRKEEEKVAISFSDTGMGMPRTVLERIFNPFFTTKEVGKGTGLGLAVSHGIIKNFKGSIRVESGEGKGTTFIIRLPYETKDGNSCHV
jgi:signal transduction histidine kinase